MVHDVAYAKYPFYQLYTLWTTALVILYLLKIITFSVAPSVIGIFIGGNIFLLYKFYISKKSTNIFPQKINYFLGLILIVWHTAPLFLIPLKFNHKDLIYNIAIFVVYNITLAIQGTNIAKVYLNLLEGQPSDITIYRHFHELGLFP